MSDYTTHHLEYDLDVVMRYFIDGFTAPDGKERAGDADWFVDTAKRRVIFRVQTKDAASKPSEYSSSGESK